MPKIFIGYIADDEDEAQKVLKMLSGGTVDYQDDGDDAEAEKKAKAEKAKKAKAAKAKKEKEEAEAAAKAAEEAEADEDGDEDDGDGEEASSEHSREDVRQALKDFAALEGRDEAIKVLNDVGEASSVSELDEAKFDDVMAKLAELS